MRTTYPDDNEPITEQWLLSLGFEAIKSHLGPGRDLLREGVLVWEHRNEPGSRIWNNTLHAPMRTRRKLRDLLIWLEDSGPLCYEEKIREETTEYRNSTDWSSIDRRAGWMDTGIYQ